MSNHRVILFTVIAATILCHSHTYAGPVRSLASVVAARSAQSKIPRSIRTPFRNTEMMTARGFGKRSQQYNGEHFIGAQSKTKVLIEFSFEHQI